MTDTQRRQWNTPKLTVLGDVETLTQKDKHVGSSDGFTFQGVPISG